MREWDFPADRAVARSLLEIMKMNSLQESTAVGELEKVKMTIADLTNRLGVAENAVGKDRELVWRLQENNEGVNNRFVCSSGKGM